MSSPLTKCIMLYMVIILAFLFLKPPYCFDNLGEAKEFGCGNNQIIFTFYIISLLITIVGYFFLTLLQRTS